MISLYLKQVIRLELKKSNVGTNFLSLLYVDDGLIMDTTFERNFEVIFRVPQMNSFVEQKKGPFNMDNIVRSFEEIDLTEAELEVICGAQGAPALSDVANLFDASGTQVVLNGTSSVTTSNVIFGSFTKTLSL